MTPLVVAIALAADARSSVRRFFLLGVAAGAVYFLGTVYWVVTVMAMYGGLSILVALPIGLLLVFYLAAYPGLFAVMVGLAIRRFGVAGVWLAPFAWVTSEWLRATVGGGFPWALLGTSQVPMLPVAQFASVAGVYGLGALVALVGTAAAAVALTRRRTHLVGAAGVFVFLTLVVVAGLFRLTGSELTRTGQVLRVGLVQGNIPQDQKWDPSYKYRILTDYLDLSRQVLDAGAGLVAWPEAATPFFFDAEAVMAEPIRRLAIESRTPFVIGTDAFEAGSDGAPDRIYNSAALIGIDGRTRATYRKIQLVPFGEYVPLQQLLFFVGPLVEAVSAFSPGVDPTVLDTGDYRVSVSICYESVYPWLSRAFARRGSQLLMTITNDAWFGRSSAAYQHFDQGALRAIEQGRYMVRAANTGISGAVDPYGRVLARTPLFERVALTVDVRLIESSTIYGRTGDVIVWVSLGLCGGLVAMVTFGRRRPTARSAATTHSDLDT